MKKFIVLTCAVSGKKAIVKIDNIAFAAYEKGKQDEQEVTFTRVYLEQAQVPEGVPAVIDVEETPEEIARMIGKYTIQ